MLIALAGLPGTGKSTIAARLAQAVGGVVLSKDVCRAALFPHAVLDCSREEDEIAMAAIYQAAGYIVRTYPERPILLDGRTFLRTYQVRDLVAWAAGLGQQPCFIECVCDDSIARERLESDRARGVHPAANRTFELYETLKRSSEPLPAPLLRLDTGATSLEECVERCLAALRSADR